MAVLLAFPSWMNPRQHWTFVPLQSLEFCIGVGEHSMPAELCVPLMVFSLPPYLAVALAVMPGRYGLN